jgi:hypothetical protein
MTTTLALAARLRTLEDDALVAALHARTIRRAGVSDFFDLADALLDDDSVQRALVGRDRTQLATLIALGRAGGPLDAAGVVAALRSEPATAGLTAPDATAALEALSGLLLVHPQTDGEAQSTAQVFASYDAVYARLAGWPESGLPAPDDLLRTPPPAISGEGEGEEEGGGEATTSGREHAIRPATDRLAADRAFDAVVAVSELLAELAREGARELQRGGLALPAAKRLADALAVDPAVVPTVFSVASRAGLVAVDAGVWLPAEASGEWLHASTSDRWRALAAAWLATLPDDLRTLIAAHSRARWGESLRDHVSWLHPADAGEALRSLAARLADAEWLGVTAGDMPGAAGTALIELGPEAASAALAPGFPAEVRGVYLQHDLSVVSPGPLAPDLEARLRGMADLESRALASTFRFSPASVDRAITAGETATSIREFLAGISLTGLPQPLDYLIADVTQRHGRVRVRTVDDAETRSAVHSADPTLLRTIEVDQSLSALRLAQAGPGVLRSRAPRDVVFWALSDARYPVVAEDEQGEPVALRRQRYAQPHAVTSRDLDRELVERLRASDHPTAFDTGEQWLVRQLDQAVRARQPVAIEVAMPDGSVVDLILEPTGLGGGRLRGRDRAADIERTLPLSSVKAVRPV